jgi:hypothetical protein
MRRRPAPTTHDTFLRFSPSTAGTAVTADVVDQFRLPQPHRTNPEAGR